MIIRLFSMGYILTYRRVVCCPRGLHASNCRWALVPKGRGWLVSGKAWLFLLWLYEELSLVM